MTESTLRLVGLRFRVIETNGAGRPVALNTSNQAILACQRRLEPPAPFPLICFGLLRFF